jgi:hypothetical protein
MPVNGNDLNQSQAMKKPKIVLSTTQLKSRDSGERMLAEDFAIYASYQINAGGFVCRNAKGY